MHTVLLKAYKGLCMGRRKDTNPQLSESNPPAQLEGHSPETAGTSWHPLCLGCLPSNPIMVWIGTLKPILFQPSCYRQEHLPLDQVPPSLGWGFHISSGQPLPVPLHPHSKFFFPNIWSKSILFQLEAIPPSSLQKVSLSFP